MDRVFEAGSENSPRLGRLHRLDGLRGVLAVYVMLGHAAPFIPWPPGVGRAVEAVVSHGLATVNLFFALSGLVIVQSMTRFEGRMLPFIAARARRLLPVYMIVLAASVLLLAAGSPLALMPWLHQGGAASEIWEAGLPAPLLVHLATHLTLIQGALPRGLLPGVEFSLLGPAWSLSTDWQFYAVIAVLMTWIGNDRRGLSVLVMLFLALAVAARGFAWLVGMAVKGDRMAFSLIWGPLALIVPIGLAALLHYGVERKFMRARRFLQPGEAARPVSPAL